jgi:hypothetical protein
MGVSMCRRASTETDFIGSRNGNGDHLKQTLVIRIGALLEAAD